MRSLHLDPDLVAALRGALLAVARADGIVNASELAALDRILDGLPAVDPEALFFSDVGPVDLAAAVARAHEASPYRRGAVSSRAEIAAAFVEAAHRVALADGSISDAEYDAIAAFSRALGLEPGARS